MKNIVKISLLMLISLTLLTGCQKKEEIDLKGINFDIEGNITNDLNYDTKNPLVAMKIKDYGAIVIELYPDIAPNTVDNFMYLVSTSFYDNNNFHRLAKGFVLQGGDPKGNGTGGPGYSIQGEFTKNNFKNDLKHTKGIVSMARSSLPNTAGSQFFIMLGSAPSLDGSYAAFGKVIDGMDIIDKIENKAKVKEKSDSLIKNIIIEKALVKPNGKEIKEPKKN